MKGIVRASLLLMGWGLSGQSQLDAAALTKLDVTRPLAFIDVSVISMSHVGVTPHQTVLVQGQNLLAIGPSDVIRIPPSALRIPGSGRYLMPGLTDMHVHFRRVPSASDTAYAQMPDYQERNQDAGALLVANGVTSVRQLHGHPEGDRLSAQSSSNAWLGPTIYSTGPITDGDPPVHPFNRVITTPKDAVEAVNHDKAAGYIAVKVYDNLTLPVYDAIVGAAAKANIDVVGHIPWAVGVDRVIAAHQATIEHADSFLPSLWPRDGDYMPPPDDVKYSELIRRADLSKLPDIADRLRRAGIWTCPTVAVDLFDSATYAQAREQRYIPREFTTKLHEHWEPGPFDDELAYGLAVVRILHERGAGLLLGTDVYIVVPGFSALQELEYFVQAGLTPYEALQTGTVNAARALHHESDMGSVDVGKRADLLLLEANPLDDIRNVRKRVGVMLRGRWFPESDLTARLQKIADGVAAIQN